MPLQTWGQLVEDAKDSGQQSFEPLPDGRYDLKITEATLRKSASDKDGFNITAVVENGPYANRKVFNTFWVSPDSPGAMGIFFRQFAALGLDKAYFQGEPTNEKIVADLVNRRFVGTLSTSEYQGKKRNEVKGVDPATGPAPVAPAGPTPGVPTVAAAAPAAVPTPSVPVPPAGSGWGQAPAAPAAPPVALPETPANEDAPATPVPPALPPLSGPAGGPPAF